MLTMIIGGLWHGAAWTFVLWGAFHGTMLIAEHALGGRLRAPGWLRWLVTFHLVVLSWILFRSQGIDTFWDYLSEGPFPDRASYRDHLSKRAASDDPLFFAIVDRASGEARGRAALMRIDAENRVIEVGHILYGRDLRRTRGATEAMYLLARYVFDDLGYRRYEWKCNALNAASRAAALRLGFTFEGSFRQHMIVKGRNRDTAWFSMIDAEWPDRKARFERWLDPANFDEHARQRAPLDRHTSLSA